MAAEPVVSLGYTSYIKAGFHDPCAGGRDKRYNISPRGSLTSDSYNDPRVTPRNLNKFRMEIFDTQAAYKPRQEKLRSSCDGCSSSKVRCEKQHPSCFRCQELGQVCIYGKSRRRGKPASKPYGSGTAPSGKAVHPTWDYSTELSQVSIENFDYSSWQMSQILNGFEAGGSQWLEKEATLRPGTIDGSHLHQQLSYTHNDSISASVSTASDENFQSPSHSTDAALPTSIKTPHATSSAFEKCVSECEKVLPGTNSGGKPSCITIAMTTLSSLYQLTCDSTNNIPGRSPNIEGSNAPPNHPSSNSAILIARAATQKLGQLLACTCASCNDDPSMFFILANIASKALGWYKSLYNSNIQSLYNGASLGNGNLLSPSHRQSLTDIEDALASMPLTISTIHLPRATELRIRAQLLLCELQPLAQACNALGTRHQHREGVNSEEAVYDSFRGFLQRGIKELSRSLEGNCGQLGCTENM